MTEIGLWEIVLRFVTGGLLGGLVGLEREYAGQDAGFRTHLLLGLGSATFGVVSVGAFDAYVADPSTTNVTIDVTRIASYVAPGVGFIGGGAILKHRGTVRGITTATSLWTAAAVGLCSGVGFWLAATITTALALLALAVLKPLSRWVDRRRNPPASLVILLGPSGDGAAVLGEIQSVTLPAIKVVRLVPDDDGTSELAVEFWSRPDDAAISRITDLLSVDRDDIRSVTMTA